MWQRLGVHAGLEHYGRMRGPGSDLRAADEGSGSIACLMATGRFVPVGAFDGLRCVAVGPRCCRTNISGADAEPRPGPRNESRRIRDLARPAFRHGRGRQGLDVAAGPRSRVNSEARRGSGSLAGRSHGCSARRHRLLRDEGRVHAADQGGVRTPLEGRCVRSALEPSERPVRSTRPRARPPTGRPSRRGIPAL